MPLVICMSSHCHGIGVTMVSLLWMIQRLNFVVFVTGAVSEPVCRKWSLLALEIAILIAVRLEPGETMKLPKRIHQKHSWQRAPDLYLLNIIIYWFFSPLPNDPLIKNEGTKPLPFFLPLQGLKIAGQVLAQESISIWVFPKIGTPKWMVKIMENPIKMGWFGGSPIFGNTHISLCYIPKWMCIQRRLVLQDPSRFLQASGLQQGCKDNPGTMPKRQSIMMVINLGETFSQTSRLHLRKTPINHII